MIFVLAVCFCAIASAAATQLSPKDITPMVSVSERLAVIKRTHTTETQLQCHSALKLKEEQADKYKYNLRARKTTFVEYEYISDDVLITLEKIPGTETKRSTYTAGNTKTTLTLVHLSQGNKCFVVSVDKNSTFKGCELITPASNVENIPSDCETFFNTNCKGKTVQLYQPDCNYK
uniref:Lipocalin/cytosolic fatty-acid binding domain-containing protein n=1 Tax=Amblyomma maculatum TaxID=34609 RepID=G3MRR2_AMBMU